jgi:hypothetical protein
MAVMMILITILDPRIIARRGIIEVVAGTMEFTKMPCELWPNSLVMTS